MISEILRVEKLNKFYGDLQALKDISFGIQPGEIIGLLGHNGAGKSTLIKCMMGAIKSYTGDIYISGSNIKNNHSVIVDNAGFLLEPSFCDYLSAQTNLELLNSVASKTDRKKLTEVLETVSLKKFSGKKVGEFSFGMKQRLGLAQVLLTNPKLIVLDEPTVGLDPLGVEIVKNIIIKCSNNNVAVLFSSHQINDVFDICHRAIIMNDGKIVYDGAAAKLNTKKYVVKCSLNINQFAKALKQFDSELQVNGTEIRFIQTSAISDVLRFILGYNLEIVDFYCENSMNELIRLMKN